MPLGVLPLLSFRSTGMGWVPERSMSGQNTSSKIPVNRLTSLKLYIFSHINDKPRLPLCKLGSLVTKFVRWSLSRYISLDLFFHKVSWLSEIVFYFTIDISGKPFLLMNSPRFMYIDWKYYCAKNDEKLEMVDKN